MRWISDFAPTSTPRVGSSRKMTFGIDRQQLGDRHLLLIAARKIGHRLADMAAFEVQHGAQPFGQPGLQTVIEYADDDETWRSDKAEMFSAIGHLQKQAISLAVFRQVDKPFLNALLVIRRGQDSAIEHDFRPSPALQACRCPFDDFAAPGPDQPTNAKDFALLEVEGDTREPALLGQVTDREDHSIGLLVLALFFSDRACR